MRRTIRIALVCACTLAAAVIVTLAILAVALPVVVRDGQHSREASAVKLITTIQTAQVQYYSSYNRFAASMQELGPPAGGAEGPSAAGLIERDLATGEKAGYRFTLTPTPAGYTINAVPTQYGTSGTKTYFSDQGIGIHQHIGPEPATANDPLMGEPAPPQQQ